MFPHAVNNAKKRNHDLIGKELLDRGLTAFNKTGVAHLYIIGRNRQNRGPLLQACTIRNLE